LDPDRAQRIREVLINAYNEIEGILEE
jgi:hypothetical protein